MSYLALARKWRPKTFADLVGQPHVVRALMNALSADKVHHAYLFAGTRGVGKTTIARILAKALNCESGVSAEPCGKCTACKSIDEGRFVDLLEVDAASRTKVDDTRDLLDNVQYAPAAGRFKVYLIDEVHMLSKHSFNALLKTLEEPPPHVKFLLATTDPQQLPVTVLSRCLQFNLKRLPSQLIVERMEQICKAEKIKFGKGALPRIARAAAGSMRDGLSLLDQSLAFGAGKLKDADVAEMLGSLDQKHLRELLQCLASGDASGLMAQVTELHELVPDYASVLETMASVLQEIAVVQMVGIDSLDEDADHEMLAALAVALSPEAVQLFYQIAITGRRDMEMAPDPRIGFEMTLLRMLSFQPASESGVTGSSSSGGSAAETAGKRKPAASPVRQTPRAAENKSAKSAAIPQDAAWPEIVNALALKGAVRQLAEHCALVERTEKSMVLAVNKDGSFLLTEQQQEKLVKELRGHIHESLKVEFRVVDDAGETIARQAEDESAQQLRAAKESIASDPALKELVDLFGAEIDSDSIRPLD